MGGGGVVVGECGELGEQCFDDVEVEFVGGVDAWLVVGGVCVLVVWVGVGVSCGESRGGAEAGGGGVESCEHGLELFECFGGVDGALVRGVAEGLVEGGVSSSGEGDECVAVGGVGCSCVAGVGGALECVDEEGEG